jgi:protocatechuate 3,4-dioxygenase beta subunit
MLVNRRRFFAQAGLGSLLFARRGLFAETLVQTPAQTLGPYYPDRMPLDQDNDLLVINDNITPAVGQVSWVSGRVLSPAGSPVRGALVEIWQADNNGAYIHSQSPIANRDANFQGYGKFLTGSTGEYLFRTVKPGLYPGRTRHIHYQITMPGSSRQQLVTQLYVEGDSLNSSDGVLNGIRDAAQRNSVIVPWTPVPSSTIGELAARFDIVMGYTPADPPASRPSILATNGVVEGAGFQAGLTPGSWIALFGDNLSLTSRAWGSVDIVDGKLPTSLDGVSVRINGKAAAVYYVSPGQINVQAPDDETTGPVQVTVTNTMGTSDAVTAQLAQFLPGFFVGADYMVGANPSPARPGETVSLFGTGFGPTNPKAPAGEAWSGAAPLANAVTVRIGGRTADVHFAGLVSAGVYQLNVVVPDLDTGVHDVRATVGGVRTQPLARLAVQRG